MYTKLVTSQDSALCHLFFHCCFKDGEFKKSEVENVSAKLVAAGLHNSMNFKDEVIKYQHYQASITDEITYLQFLISLIQPANELALYSYCAELCLSDSELSAQEENLLKEIGRLLSIEETSQAIIKKLMAERKVVELQKLF